MKLLIINAAFYALIFFRHGVRISCIGVRAACEHGPSKAFAFFFKTLPRFGKSTFIFFLRISHKLALTFTFLFFYIGIDYTLPNPSSLNQAQNEIIYVNCPDGQAYKTNSGFKIKCEDFDKYYANLYNGVERTDLYLKE